MKNSPEISLILHNIRSAYNVGSIFRTAACLPTRREAAGVQKIYLTGYTPPPRDRFGRVNKEVVKTALGAENFVPWEKFSNISKLIYYLTTNGANETKKLTKIIALEQAPNSIDYRQIKITGPTAIIMGNEVRGLSKLILNQCDQTAEIPMCGHKESLNVSVAIGIFLFQILS